MTVTRTTAALVSRFDGTVTTRDVPVCDRTAKPVWPKVTVEEAMKFVPVIVTVVAAAPAVTVDGDRLVTVGAGLIAAGCTRTLSNAQYSSELSPPVTGSRSKVSEAVDVAGVNVSTGFPEPWPK